MNRSIHKHLVRILLLLSGLMLLAGCDTTTNPLSYIDQSAASTDLASFIQQFAREALAAFLL